MPDQFHEKSTPKRAFSPGTDPDFNTDAPPFEVGGGKVILGGAFYAEGGCNTLNHPSV